MCGDCSDSAAASIGATANLERGTTRPETSTESTPKQQEDFSSQEFKAYCQKRLDLFLQYKQRQDEKVSGQGG